MENDLTPEFYHLLEILSEELSEMQIEISKIQRFGINSYNPIKNKSNIELFNTEYNDALGIIDMLKGMEEDKIECMFGINKFKQEEKQTKVKKMMEISRLNKRL